MIQATQAINELIDSIEVVRATDISDLILTLATIETAARECGSDFADLLRERIERIALANGLCPKCAGELEEIDSQEYYGECHGVPAYKTLFVRRCAACGWNEQE